MLFKGLIFGTAMLAALAGAGCTTTGTLNSEGSLIVTDAKNVCGVVINDSSGAIETLISTFPLGTAVLTIVNSVCDAVNAVPVTAAASRFGGPQSVVVNGVTIPYTKG